MSCENGPTADTDTIYLLDNLGTPIPCNKDGNNFICSNVLYGKIPVLATGGSTCQWKLCDVDTINNKVDLDSCKATNYPYYSEPTQVNGKDGCKLVDFKNPDTTTVASSCCCDADSLCDFITCCPGGHEEDCGFKDFTDHFFNVSYLQKAKNQYFCLPHGKSNICAQVPGDYTQSPEHYPQIKGPFYASSLCDCVKDETACESNPSNCVPKPQYTRVGTKGVKNVGACVACNPGQKPGSWVCDKGVCTSPASGEGVYQTQDDCSQNCGLINRYSCVSGICKKDPEGVFFSAPSCQNGCKKLSSTPSDYDLRKTVTKVLALLAFGALILILLLVLFYVFNLIRRRQREGR